MLSRKYSGKTNRNEGESKIKRKSRPGKKIYKYINIGNRKKTSLSSLQACFVIAHSSGDFNVKDIHNHPLNTLRLHYWGKFKFKCLVVR